MHSAQTLPLKIEGHNKGIVRWLSGPREVQLEILQIGPVPSHGRGRGPTLLSAFDGKGLERRIMNFRCDILVGGLSMFFDKVRIAVDRAAVGAPHWASGKSNTLLVAFDPGDSEIGAHNCKRRFEECCQIFTAKPLALVKPDVLRPFGQADLGN